jgi:serine/threonine protein kinase
VTNQRTGSVAAATSREFVSGQKVFGRYALVKVLGRGGMGIVWLAHDEELERDVALKFLPDLMIQDHALLDQLKRETKRCLELTHLHIVRIHDFVHDERSASISMEYVDGETLSNLRAEKERRVFEPDEIAGWIAQLCDALDYAHNRAKVIHCDLKPANLMVNQRGDLKITDFGIARSLADSVSRLTAEQGRSGTLVYMSPQQLNGECCTHLSDIYSLGATIYELLTSKPPFYSGNIDRQICERVALSMTERRKEFNIEPAFVAQPWEKVVAACLAKDPSRRPQSAGEVGQRLQLPSGQARIAVAPVRPANKKLLLFAGIAAASALVLASVYFAAPKRHATAVQVPHPPAIPDKSIAVLPFENRSEEKANAYFAEGIQDEIIRRLSKIADLRVISRTSTQRYDSSPSNLREIAEQLGVANILEGSVQKVADEVRVNVQLIKAQTDSHLFADTYDRKLTDIFGVQSEIAEKIATSLQARLTNREQIALKSTPTEVPEAYDLYLRARYLLHQRTAESIRRARELFQQAVARDPAFALGHAGIAEAYILLAEYGEISNAEASLLAWPEVSSALAIDDRLSDAHASRAILLADFDWNWAAADPEYRRAIELNANNVTARHWYALYLAELSRFDEALAQINVAQKLDPLTAVRRAAKARILFVARRYDEALEECQGALDLQPNFPAALDEIIPVYTMQKKFREAIEATSKYPDPSDNDRSLQRAYVYAAAGEKNRAEEIVRGVTSAPGSYGPYDMALICAALQKPDEALGWLATALDRHSLSIVWAQVDPRLDSIRAHPGFRELLARLVPRRPTPQ